jgi:hypothetical protein
MRDDEQADLVAPGGAVASSGAAVLACAACCVLPLAWPAVGLVLSGGVIAWLESAQTYFTALAAVPVVWGWWLVFRQSRSGKRRHPWTLPLMGAATALIGVAIFWLDIEPHLIRVIESGQQAASAQGKRP